MKSIKYPKNLVQALSGICLMAFILMLMGCGPDDPKKEDVPELITKATLTFTPSGGGLTIIVTATDPDGEGIQDLTVDGPINLAANKTYVLTIALINQLADITQPEYHINDEVEEEGDEHQFFFEWTNGIFSNPAGSGNIGASGTVNYTGAENSKDKNGRPLGLTTTWTTATPATGTLTGSFHVLLKHQPGLKSDTSGSNIGETDLDVEWVVSVE